MKHRKNFYQPAKVLRRKPKRPVVIVTSNCVTLDVTGPIDVLLTDCTIGFVQSLRSGATVRLADKSSAVDMRTHAQIRRNPDAIKPAVLPKKKRT